MVGAIVYRELICAAVDFKMAPRDAVGIAAGAFAEAGAVGHIVGCAAVGESHILDASLAVGHADTGDSGAERRDLGP